MQSLKNIVINGAMILALLVGLTVSAAADFASVKALAEQGDAFAQARLGSSYYSGRDVRQDYVKAFYWHQKSADQGLAEGQALLGGDYLTGKGVRQDYAKAFYWHQKSANQGLAHGQLMVGSAYLLGQGVRQSNSQAKEWFGKACDSGLRRACDSYRMLNEQGY